MRFAALLLPTIVTAAVAVAAEPVSGPVPAPAAVPALMAAGVGAAATTDYLAPVVAELAKAWPKNRAVNIVFHGHSVPAGYFRTPIVDTFHAYPALLHRALKERFPLAVINVIVTAIGGENSIKGAARFERDVLPHRPDLILIDYSLNDRRAGLAAARAAWVAMIERAQAAGVKVILLTPTGDTSAKLDDDADPLNQQAAQVRALAAEYHTGLVDSLALFKAEIARGAPLGELMSQVNHPNARGHQLVADALLAWFPAPPPAPSSSPTPSSSSAP